MKPVYYEIVVGALKLPAHERVLLAQELMASLETDIDPDTETLWLDEAERRLGALRKAESPGVEMDAAFAKARKVLRR